MSRRVVEDRVLERLIHDAIRDAFVEERAARKRRDRLHKNNIASIAIQLKKAPPKEGYASMAEFAAYVKVSKTTIHRLVKDRTLVHIVIGTQIRIPWSELGSPKILRGVDFE